MKKRDSTPAVAYLRTSSATNAGEDRDSYARQWAAIDAYAASAGFTIAQPAYYDAAVSGADPVDTRPGFRALLAFLGENPRVKVILVETANRFARDLIVQETGYRMLRDRGIELVAVDSPGGFLNDTPTAELIRQVMGAISQFEKASIVGKLRGARERMRAEKGKCEGRKSHAELRPEVVTLAKRLRRKPPGGRVMSFRKVAQALAERGFRNGAGNTFHASAVRSMVERRRASS